MTFIILYLLLLISIVEHSLCVRFKPHNIHIEYLKYKTNKYLLASSSSLLA